MCADWKVSVKAVLSRIEVAGHILSLNNIIFSTFEELLGSDSRIYLGFIAVGIWTDLNSDPFMKPEPAPCVHKCLQTNADLIHF